MVYIKNIRIKGFKSYKELVDLEDFSPEHNVIVGRNGSGKSNFFFAIRFVLSDMFSNLRADERLSLLHEGAGARTMSAYVEIVFDNTDGRFPIDKEEVVLRRQIGMKKDEYYLDKKVITKNDVVNLLESAGFSRSNPYYIVQQGKVNGLTMMKDTERLELLKEVAGTRVYDERREESDKLMAEADLKREKIEESLVYIDDRLKELENEKNELKEYQELDRERRALEYTIYDKEYREAQEKLTEIDNSRLEEASKAKDQYKLSLETHREVKQLEREIKTAEVDTRRLTKEKEVIDEERQDLIKARAKLELTVAETNDRMESDKEEQERLKNELEEIDGLIQETSDKLDDTKPAFEEAQREEREVQERMLDAERRVNELYSKQGRSARFSNKKERDTWIKKQVKELGRTIEAQKEQIAALEAEIEELRTTLKEDDARIEDTQKQLQEIRKSLEKNTKAYNDLTIKRDEFSNRRKELWRQDAENENNLQMYREELKKAERQLNLTLNKVTSVGLSGVNQIVDKYQIRGVYGPLIELFDCPEEYATAVEVTAGGSLFHVVVDTDTTASKIIDAFNKEGIPGRVTFVPLNRVKVGPINLPETPEARPMIDELTFNPMFKPVFQQVFAKTLICRSIEVASEYAKTHGLNCVTIEGDQVNRKGALTGGFYDIRYSRIEAMKAIKQWRGKITGIADSARKVKSEAQAVDQEVNKTLGEIEKLKVRGEKKHDTYEQMSLDLKLLMKDQLTHRDLLEQKENTLANLNVSLRQLEESVRSLEAELGTALLDRLSPSEQSELSDLTKELTTLKETQIETSAKRAKLEAEKNRLQNLLSANLLRRKAELQDEIDHRKIAKQPATLEQKSKELERVEALIEDVTKRQKDIEKSIDEKSEQIRTQKVKIDKLKAKENDEALRIQSESKVMERLINKRSLLLQKREECMRKIRELGSLPASVADYQTVPRKELLANLNEVNKRLGAYNQVNKKAFDQYVSFSEQREGLIKRKEELDVGAEKIRELIKVLDKQKDDAIERTFKGVARHFIQVFSELVPDGTGRIVMQKLTDTTGAEDKISQYTGVAIKVAFTKNSETIHMQHLSGGQKSLVALALIFAIQRCDPAPFYLFDEIDSALDTPHRTAVARMIQEQSQKEGGAQFITTTFRPELVRAATKCYGITFKNKVSTIHTISIKKALSIIKASEAEIGDAGGAGGPGSATKRAASPAKEEEEEEDEEEGGEKMEEGGEEEEEEGEEGDAMEEGGEED